MEYFANLVQDRPVKPSDSFPAMCVLADLAVPRSIIGIAYPYTHVGEYKIGGDLLADCPSPEVVWRLVIDRA